MELNWITGYRVVLRIGILAHRLCEFLWHDVTGSKLKHVIMEILNKLKFMGLFLTWIIIDKVKQIYNDMRFFREMQENSLSILGREGEKTNKRKSNFIENFTRIKLVVMFLFSDSNLVNLDISDPWEWCLRIKYKYFPQFNF